MQLLHMLAVSMLSIELVSRLVVAKPVPDRAMVLFPVGTEANSRTRLGRRALVYGLPPGWTAVFQTVTSIQPPLVNPAFIHFFSAATKLAAADPLPGRRFQRISFGALVLEFIANDGQLVTREFVIAASVWLLDAAQKGWTDFFTAWVMDISDGEVVYIRLMNKWDEGAFLTI